jgi:hypothetical protein
MTIEDTMAAAEPRTEANTRDLGFKDILLVELTHAQTMFTRSDTTLQHTSHIFDPVYIFTPTADTTESIYRLFFSLLSG